MLSVLFIVLVGACQTTIPVSHAEMSDNTSSAEDYSLDTQSFPHNMSESPAFESPKGFDYTQVRNKIMTASLFKSAFDPEAKMSAENGTLNTPRINMVKDSEPFQDLTSVRTEENSDSKVTYLVLDVSIFLKTFQIFVNVLDLLLTINPASLGIIIKTFFMKLPD
jgi:flagellar basal body rod protein FlgC